MDLQIDAGLLQRYDRPGPRYTSYPTAVEFHEGFTAVDYQARLDRLVPEQDLSLYLHLPFCAHRCRFCACHVVITPKQEVAAAYLEYLSRELAAVASRLSFRPRVIQYHWGGGTPTYYSPVQLDRLHQTVGLYFDFLPGAERAIEVDPRVTTREHIDMLAELGFNRLSMGVQDFTPQVQTAIGRNQDEDSTRALFEYCRQRGFDSINVDLVYGLPLQTGETFARNLASVVALRPDRVALYSYAHVPWIKGHQKKIDPALLPSRETKFELFTQAIRTFRASGYEQIGMDHFALPADELNQALRQRQLHRNFMGYTVHRTPYLLGLGLSAIGEIDGAFIQNHKKLITYYRTLDQGLLPVERGYELSRDDQIRRYVILELMCNLFLDTGEVEQRFGICFAEYFALELEELKAGPAMDGLVQVRADAIEVTLLGQLFIRNIGMIFDRYLREKPRPKPTFSRTV